MRTLVRILLIFTLCALLKPSWGQANPGAAIVQVYTVYTEYDYDLPWQIVRQERKTAGCIIEGSGSDQCSRGGRPDLRTGEACLGDEEIHGPVELWPCFNLAIPVNVIRSSQA
jgi:hypothetical protein